MSFRKMLISPNGRRHVMSRAPMMGFDSFEHAYVLARRMTLDAIQFVRAQKAMTARFGYQFRRSRSLIEIDATCRCDRQCPNCNRSCTQAPAREDMAAEQIESFIRQSIDSRIFWKRIRILGGEPLLHPDISTLLGLLLQYKKDHNPGTRIVLCTHGHDGKIAGLADRIPDGIDIKNSFKTSSAPWSRPFNMAPADSIFFRGSDFRAGCRIMSECGVGLTPSGYYPCAVAGGIDRVFGFDLGRKNLPDNGDSMRGQMDVFCRLCGHFGVLLPARRQKTSPVWEAAYREYQRRKLWRTSAP